MPKVSRDTAPDHLTFPGFVDTYAGEAGGWTVSIEKDLVDMDLTPFFEGAPDDLCQAHHVGFVITGRFGIRRADGTEELYEAGDAFVIEPGHIPLSFAGAEYVAFTPTEEAREQQAVMMPNILRYAQEHGIELPPEMTSR